MPMIGWVADVQYATESVIRFEGEDHRSWEGIQGTTPIQSVAFEKYASESSRNKLVVRTVIDGKDATIVLNRDSIEALRGFLATA